MSIPNPDPSEEKEPISYRPAWPHRTWEARESSWLRPPAYGSYTIAQNFPTWSQDLHDRGLVLQSPYLADIFRDGMYSFYVNMILLQEYAAPPFALLTTPGDSDIAFLPHSQPKRRARYERFVVGLFDFLDAYYGDLLEPLGVIYQRWKIVEEALARKGEFVPEVTFLKDSVQTLIGALLRSFIPEYVVCICDRRIGVPPPADTHMENFCVVKNLGLDQPKKSAMYDFIKRHKKFLKAPFPENDLDTDHYQTFVDELKPELTRIMHAPEGGD